MEGCAVPTAMRGEASPTAERECVYGRKSRGKVCIGTRDDGVMEVTLRDLSYEVVSSVLGVGSNG